MNSKPKILVFTTHPKTLLLFRIELLQLFHNKGFDLHIASSYEPSDLSSKLHVPYTFHTLPLSEFSFSPISFFREFTQLRRLITSLSIDITFSYFLKGSILSGILSRFTPKLRSFSLVEGLGRLYSHNLPLSPYLIAARLYISFLLWASVPFVSHLFFLNISNIHFFASRFCLQSSSLSLLGPIGTSIPLANPKPALVGKYHFNFLFIGRLMAEKGIDVFLQAALFLNSQGFHNFNYHILGDLPSSHPSSLRKLIDECTLVPNIHFHGFVDASPYLSSAHLLVHPSFYGEGFPMVIQESFANGVPVATSFNPLFNIPGYHQSIYPLPASPSVSSVANAILYSVDNSSLHSRMSDSAFECAKQNFDASENNVFIIDTISRTLSVY